MFYVNLPHGMAEVGYKNKRKELILNLKKNKD